MAIVVTDSKHYSDIAEAIRAKNGEETTYLPSEMAEAIAAIPNVGGGYITVSSVDELPEDAEDGTLAVVVEGDE